MKWRIKNTENGQILGNRYETKRDAAHRADLYNKMYGTSRYIAIKEVQK